MLRAVLTAVLTALFAARAPHFRFCAGLCCRPAKPAEGSVL